MNKLKIISVLIFIFCFSCSMLLAQSLTDAISNNNIDAVKKMLQANPELAVEKNPDGSHPLHYVAGYGNVEMLKLLLGYKAPVDVLTPGGSTPMMYAAMYDRNEVIEELIRAGADMQLRNQGNSSVLQIAIEFGNSQLSSKLLDLGYSLDYESEEARALLFFMARTGNDKMTNDLIKNGVPISGTDNKGRTLLINATIGNINRIVKNECEKPGINNIDSIGRNALHYAAIKGNLKAVRLMLKKEINLHHIDFFGNSVLDLANLQSDRDVIQLLKEKGVQETGKELYQINSTGITTTQLNKILPGEYIKIKYIANEGFLIQNNEKSILVDAIHGEKEGALYNRTPLDILETMIKGKPPYENIDLYLLSHWHHDHANFEQLARFMNKHSETYLVTGPEEIRMLGENMRLNSIKRGYAEVNPEFGLMEIVPQAPLTLRVIKTHHGPVGLNVTTTAFLVEISGLNILHLGDMHAELNLEIFDKMEFNDTPIDIAFIDPFIMQSEEGQRIIREKIKPKVIIMMHVGDNDRDLQFTNLSNIYSNLLVFREANEEKYFSK